ncbi:MAG: hypothetical protein ACK5NT_04875 [Pyrinomonadaceae bacterium]
MSVVISPLLFLKELELILSLTLKNSQPLICIVSIEKSFPTLNGGRLPIFPIKERALISGAKCPSVE